MSSTLLRLGLWILVIILALYVVHESFEDSPVAELVSLDTLQKALIVGGVLIVAGLLFRMLEKGTKKVVKNRCTVCRTPIPAGNLYCREHLRKILHDEDERTHMTRIRSGEQPRTVDRPPRPAPPRTRG
jgi:predicted nucleic acid-binding Zn ribbon protein